MDEITPEKGKLDCNMNKADDCYKLWNTMDEWRASRIPWKRHWVRYSIGDGKVKDQYPSRRERLQKSEMSEIFRLYGIWKFRALRVAHKSEKHYSFLAIDSKQFHRGGHSTLHKP